MNYHLFFLFPLFVIFLETKILTYLYSLLILLPLTSPQNLRPPEMFQVSKCFIFFIS